MPIADPILKRVCIAYHGEKGRFAYKAFDWANKMIFDGQLPTPLIQFALTPYGRCEAMTVLRISEQPVVTIHPSSWKGNGWAGMEPGPGEVLDTIIHELLHVYVLYVYLPRCSKHMASKIIHARSSHDNPVWPKLVEQFSPRIPGLERGVVASHRVSVREGMNVVKRVPEGAISLADLATWPSSLRASGSTRFWRRRGIPFSW